LTRSPVVGLQSFVEQGYEEAIAFHGNLELEFHHYSNHLRLVLQKHCGRLTECEAALRYFNLLHTKDLYLAVACAYSSCTAWQRFYAIYQQSIYDTACYFCHNRTEAELLAGSLPGHLFLRDASDHPRIQSYDGQVSLMNWMRAIIANKAIDEQKLKFNNFDRFDALPELADETGLRKMEAKVRTSRYGSIIKQCFKETILRLHKQERLFLSLRYEREVTLKEIGELLNMSHVNVVYHLRKTQVKLRHEITAILKNKYQLNEGAIKECREEILENPIYPLLALLKVDELVTKPME
jgi:RNA polymerase sigma factor (sigma-70 family)